MERRQLCQVRRVGVVRTRMIQNRTPAPNLEFLCKTCAQFAELPPNCFLTVTHCAEPGCKRMANGRFEAFTLGEEDKAEKHYVCAEHGWKWRQSLGPEWEMRCQSVSANGIEHYEELPRVLRDDLQGAFLGEESDAVN
jgi:hypothetical protein